MRKDFGVLILTHGRPEQQSTFRTLRRHGYTGPLWFVIDDEDPTGDRYRQLYGEQVVQFCKAEAEKLFDTGDNFHDRRSIVFARNACHEIARQLGLRYYLQLDDDYSQFQLRFDQRRRYCALRSSNLDAVFSAMLDYYIACPQMTALCMGQGGDYIGGASNVHVRVIKMLRKAMNTFFLDVQRPIQFDGRLNEDVNTYSAAARRGQLFLTTLQAAVMQRQTQQNVGGMSEIYLGLGTYVKSFYSVLFCPSAVKVSVLGSPQDGFEGHYRIHHEVQYRYCSPCILRETHRKATAGQRRKTNGKKKATA